MSLEHCSFSACTRKLYAKTLCATHYNQQRKGQSLAPIKESFPPLQEGKTCTKCRQALPVTKFYPSRTKPCGVASWCITCSRAAHKAAKEKRNASTRISAETLSHRKMRVRVLTFYAKGTLQCACCGVTHIEFLSIDHINGGGRTHREELRKKSRSIYRALIMANFPDGFRVLCHNCNQALGLYSYCPHQDPEATTEKWLNRKSTLNRGLYAVSN